MDKVRVEERKLKFYDEERLRLEGDRGRFYERKLKFYDEERLWLEGDKGRVYERKLKFYDVFDVDMFCFDENSVNIGIKVYVVKELFRE